MTVVQPPTNEKDRIEWALRERVKELTCLYGIARVTARSDLAVEVVVQQVVELLPPAWQYPEIASARIVLDGCDYPSLGFREAEIRQVASIIVRDLPRGAVEVHYAEERPAEAEGAFLAEERSLINEVARQIAVLVEQRQAEAERSMLEDKLRHVDRLTTIGKLAAGVAHEINEPLGAILGYAQLQLKSFGLPDQTGMDLERIVKAALHAREVVKKLLLFARQVPSEMRPVALGQVVRDTVFLLEAPCKRAGVQLILRLTKDLPQVMGDPSQLQQVVLNLGMNAIHAMPRGGTLRFVTDQSGDAVRLAVEDGGEGMPPEVVRRIFDPFYTTKDVGHGTGLGLSVVHGIVSAHGGTVRAESEPGKGSRLEVLLPIAPQDHDGRT
jgi:two-component system NtrC family sensor kinase